MFRLAKSSLTALAVLTLANPAVAQETIKMGALATLEGAFAALGRLIRGENRGLDRPSTSPSAAGRINVRIRTPDR